VLAAALGFEVRVVGVNVDGRTQRSARPQCATTTPRFLDIPALAYSHADAPEAAGQTVEKAGAVRQAGSNLGNGEERERGDECAEAPFRFILPPLECKVQRALGCSTRARRYQ
jgi:hypothetical protein